MRGNGGVYFFKCPILNPPRDSFLKSLNINVFILKEFIEREGESRRKRD